MATPPQIAERTAQAVSQAMVAADIGRKELSDRTNISYGSLGRKLSGRTPFDVVDLYLIATVLGHAPADFLPASFQERVSA